MPSAAADVMNGAPVRWRVGCVWAWGWGGGWLEEMRGFLVRVLRRSVGVTFCEVGFCGAERFGILGWVEFRMVEPTHDVRRGGRHEWGTRWVAGWVCVWLWVGLVAG